MTSKHFWPVSFKTFLTVLSVLVFNILNSFKTFLVREFRSKSTTRSPWSRRIPTAPSWRHDGRTRPESRRTCGRRGSRVKDKSTVGSFNPVLSVPCSFMPYPYSPLHSKPECASGARAGFPTRGCRKRATAARQSFETTRLHGHSDVTNIFRRHRPTFLLGIWNRFRIYGGRGGGGERKNWMNYFSCGNFFTAKFYEKWFLRSFSILIQIKFSSEIDYNKLYAKHQRRLKYGSNKKFNNSFYLTTTISEYQLPCQRYQLFLIVFVIFLQFSNYG